MDPSTMGEPLPVDADGVPMGDFGDPESEKDDIKSEIREVLEETGVVKPVKAKPEEYQRWSVEAIEAIAKSLGVTLPDKPWMAAKGGPQGGEGGVGGLGVLAPGSSGEASHMPLEDSMGGGMFDDMSAPVKSASSISQRMRRRAMSV